MLTVLQCLEKLKKQISACARTVKAVKLSISVEVGKMSRVEKGRSVKVLKVLPCDTVDTRPKRNMDYRAFPAQKIIRAQPSGVVRASQICASMFDDVLIVSIKRVPACVVEKRRDCVGSLGEFTVDSCASCV